jgi:HEAT repeats
MTAGCHVTGAVVLGALVLGSAAAGSAQGRFTNARTETRSAAQGLDRELQAAAARSGVTWVGYRVPMIPGPRQMCCYDSTSSISGDCCGTCRLESGGGVTMTTGDVQQRGTRVVLEPATEFLVLARFEAGKVTRIRTFTPDCDVDASGLTLVWLNDVKPDESVAWLESLTDTKQAIHAIAMQSAPSALNVLIRTARQDPDKRRRSDALFWLAQRAGQQAVATITDAINNDPETEVKKKAVFALSQLPHDEGVPKLIEIARTHRNPEVKKQAFFWLGQTKDPRAIALFEEILLKR